MNTSEQINEIAAALAKAQGAFQNVSKNREVVVRTKAGATYKFKYATLDAIIEMIRKPLSDNALAFVQSIDKINGSMGVDTRLYHTSGQWMQIFTPMTVDGEGNQALGSAVSYAKRYALSSLLGIASEDDDDANASDGNQVEHARDVGNGGERQLTKPQARPEYEKLVKELQAQPTVVDLEAWGARNKSRLAAMPSDWQMSLKNEYADHKTTLMESVQ